MTDREKFEQHIASRPWDDDAARRIYADWLDEQGDCEEADRQRQWVKAARWLREAAEQCGEKDWEGNPFTFEDMVQAGRDYVETNKKFTQYGDTSVTEFMWDNIDKYWRCWSIVTGVKLPDDFDHGQPFRCSC